MKLKKIKKKFDTLVTIGHNVNKSILCILLLISNSALLNAQSEILNAYVTQGLENNIVLKQKEYTLKQSLYSLKEAKGLFMPHISVQTRYTFAEGGRTIDFPIGDLHNPIHETLNEFLTMLGEDGQFPTDMENQTFSFYRAREHETKFHVEQAILEPAIYYNYKINKERMKLSEAEIDTYKSQLILDIKIAYLNYLKAHNVNHILENAITLSKENQSLIQKYYNNLMVTEDQIWKAKSEVSKIETQLAEAKRNINNAKAYFNFLLNRNLDEQVLIDSLIYNRYNILDHLQLNLNSIQNRSELAQINSGINALNFNININKASYLPSLFFVFDYGFQGTEYTFTSEDDFMISTFALKWDIFSGFQNKAKIQQSVIAKDKMNLKMDEVEQKIQLEVELAIQEVIYNKKKNENYKQEIKVAENFYEIINNKYKEGQALQIELNEARNSLTNSKIMSAISEFDYLQSIVKLEHAAGIILKQHD